jgi:hypothetical protein
MSYHRFPTCKASGKVRFGERKDIKLALRQADRNRSQALLNEVPCSRREIRAYRCSDCNGGWHLTASPERLIRLVPAALTEYAYESPARTIRHAVDDSEVTRRRVA